MSQIKPPKTLKRKQSQEDVTEEKIILNIGGDSFHISKETFDKLEDFESKAQKNKDGEYFIDRDGEMFAYILKYLRNNKITFPNDFKDKDTLMNEAKFYGISKLADDLNMGGGSPQTLLMMIMTAAHEQTMFPFSTVDVFLQVVASPEVFLNSIFDETFNIHITKPKGVETGLDTFRHENGNQFKNEMKRNTLIFAATDLYTESKFLNFLFQNGFTLVGNTMTTNVTHFNKPYTLVKQMIFQRIKPVHGEMT